MNKLAKMTDFAKVVVPQIPQASIGEYNGHKLVILKRSAEDTFPFQFGMEKAKLIVSCYDAIKDFVESHKE